MYPCYEPRPLPDHVEDETPDDGHFVGQKTMKGRITHGNRLKESIGFGLVVHQLQKIHCAILAVGKERNQTIPLRCHVIGCSLEDQVHANLELSTLVENQKRRISVQVIDRLD